MRGLATTLGAVFFLAAATAARGQNPPPGPGGNPPPGQQGGGIKTPDMDPYQNKAAADPRKELPRIASEAARAAKKRRSLSGAYSYHFVDMSQGKDVRYRGTFKAAEYRGKMNLIWDATKAPEPARRHVVSTKILHFREKDKTYERIDYARLRKNKEWPAELFFAEHFNPSFLKRHFEITLTSLAGKYNEDRTGKDTEKGPAEDPFAEKAREFYGNKDQPDRAAAAGGPDPDLHHVFQLTPKDKDLAKNLPSVTLHVHYRTFVISRAVLKLSADGSKKITVDLSDVKINPEIDEDEVKPVTDGYTEKKD